MITGSTPKLELNARDRKEIVRKIRTLENYLGSLRRVKYGTANYIVGGGHRPTPATDSEEFNKRVAEDWKTWAENASLCDRAGKNTVYDMQHMMASSLMGDGEGFILPQKTPNGFPQLLVVDPMLVGSPMSGTDTGVVDGVRIDKAGKVMGYHILSEDSGGSAFYSRKTQYFRRNQVFHYCNFERAHQVRGRSPLHAAANHFHDIIDLIALEIQATKTHQAMAIHVKKTKDSSISLESEFDDVEEAMTTAEGGSYEKEKGISAIRGATVVEDPEVDEVNLLTSNRPNVSITPFIEMILRMCAEASNFPYEFLYNMSNIGGAPARYVLADAYNTILQNQRRMERQINFPIYRWWLASRIKMGAYDNIEIPEKWWKVTWTFPAKVTMDIKHDGKQMLEVLERGQATEQELFEAQGKSRTDHVDRRIAELKEVIVKCKDAGVPHQYYYQQFKQEMVTAMAADKNDNSEDS